MPKLKYLDLENAIITKFPDETFSNNESITELTLPKDLTSIGKAFYFNEQSKNIIEKINIPDNSKLTCIDDNAFRNCSNLYYFNIPANVTYIGSYAFCNCRNLNSAIVIPKNVTTHPWPNEAPNRPTSICIKDGEIDFPQHLVAN